MRADLYLVTNSYAESRQKAQRFIKNGYVSIDGKTIDRPSAEIDENIEHSVKITETESERYVSRGGLKLEGAMRAFGISAEGLVCADIGASTGGFTDCLLQRGAAVVFAVDSGSGQLAPSLCEDARVINIENCNARYLCAEMLGGRFPATGADLAVMDVSFISQTFILPALSSLLAAEGDAITLIKPQFEVGRSAIGKGGIVRDATARRECIRRVLECACTVGLYPTGLIRSPIEGGDGNVEYLAHFRKNSDECREIAALLRGIPI